jgi:inorganic pyrophosphatase
MQGDNDPLDMVELGSSSMDIGFCFYGKVLGSFCLIDQGEIDWKILILN